MITMLKNRITTIVMTLLLASPLYVGPVEGADDSDTPKTRKRSNHRGASRDAAQGAHQRVKDEAIAKKNEEEHNKKAKENHDKAHARNHPLFTGRDWKKAQRKIEKGKVDPHKLSFTELYDADLKYLVCDARSSHAKLDNFKPNRQAKKGKYGLKYSAGNDGKVRLIFPEEIWGEDYNDKNALLEQHLYWDIQLDDVSFDYNGIIVLKSETPAKETSHCRYEVNKDALPAPLEFKF